MYTPVSHFSHLYVIIFTSEHKWSRARLEPGRNGTVLKPHSRVWCGSAKLGEKKQATKTEKQRQQEPTPASAGKPSSPPRYLDDTASSLCIQYTQRCANHSQKAASLHRRGLATGFLHSKLQPASLLSCAYFFYPKSHIYQNKKHFATLWLLISSQNNK